MGKLILMVVGFLVILVVAFLGITAPIARSLGRCFKEVNIQQENISKKVRQNELAKEEIKNSYYSFIEDVQNCRIKTTQETQRPQWLVDLVFKISFKGREFPSL